MNKIDALKLAFFSTIRYGYILLFAFFFLATLGVPAYQSPLYLLFGFSFVMFFITKLYLHQLNCMLSKT